MIKLNRAKDNKWILQKNVKSAELLESFVLEIQNQKNEIDHSALAVNLKEKKRYHGRNKTPNKSTMGVRLSQACFYMFGYKIGKKFYPSPMTDLYANGSVEREKIALVNLFSLQFPSPYSLTPKNFQIYVGRFLLTLLRDSSLDEKLYIDEIVYFLPFIEKIDRDSYSELVESILEFRAKSFDEKTDLFKSVPNYEEIFSNCMHEINYYFLRIFTDLGCLETIPDETHNNGNLFRFKHGDISSETYRNDAYATRKNCSGYIKINSNLIEAVDRLLEKYTLFETPLTQGAALSKLDWIRDLYEFEPLKYIEEVIPTQKNKVDLSNTIQSMVHESKYGTNDGKSFERSLEPIFELFRENRNVEIISGSGDTDLLCVMEKSSNRLYKINVDAKKSKNSTSSINPVRITNHIDRNASEYCIIVSPKFSTGVKTDIKEYKIVTIEAETLAQYCLKECFNSNDGLANYSVLNEYILENLGTDITNTVKEMINNKYLR